MGNNFKSKTYPKLILDDSNSCSTFPSISDFICSFILLFLISGTGKVMESFFRTLTFSSVRYKDKIYLMKLFYTKYNRIVFSTKTLKINTNKY